MSLFTLFLKLLKINTFTFGGGYTIIPIIRDEFVKSGYITDDDMDNIIAISQSIPGVLVVSTSFQVGHKIKGRTGAFVATFASVLPSFIIISVITAFYEKFVTNPYVKFYLKNVAITVAAIMLITAIVLFKKGITQSKYKFVFLFVICLILKLLGFEIKYIIVISVALSMIIMGVLDV